jgi:SAM-dependent methyltransferase
MSDEKSDEKSYVIGTHDAEIERLGVQHRVWRASSLDLWNIAGLNTGMTVIDAGAGPGYATLDAAEIVGASARVIAVERSHRFLENLRAAAAARHLHNIELIESDLLEFEWPEAVADFVWCRWVLAFAADPEAVLRGVARSLKPGGVFVAHEYYDYGAWRLAPHSPIFEIYVAKIIAKWRAAGGEPDIGLELPRLLPRVGLEIEFVRPTVFSARMCEFPARWPNGFARGYLPAMLQEGEITAAEATEISELLDRYEADPNALVMTPGVLQLVARKSG